MINHTRSQAFVAFLCYIIHVGKNQLIMEKEDKGCSNLKNLLVNAGFHCIVLGMAGVLALILLGFLSCCLGLSEKIFYVVLALGLVIAIALSAFCMKCNCSSLNKKQE